MDKSTLLAEIRSGIDRNELTKEEVLTAIGQSSPVASEVSRSAHLSSSDILYYIGGGIVFLGISILIGGSWSDLSVLTRLLVTLGSGVIAYFLGAFFVKEERYGRLSDAFFLISALVLPIGIYTAYDSAGVNLRTLSAAVTISAILTALYAISYWFYRRVLFSLFTIVFATSLFFGLVNLVVGGRPAFDYRLYLYETLVVGISYLAIGYQFRTNSVNRILTAWLFSFGTIALLGSALGLGGWSPNHNVVWELGFILLVYLVMAAGVKLRSRSLVLWGAIFLMIYIIKLTAEYFSSELGWPLALVLAGLALIGVGYYLFYLNKRYLAKTV